MAKPTALIKYEADAPVKTGGALKALLETQSEGLMALLPKHLTPERLLKTMLVAANRTPKILDCTQASILETVTRAAELGLDLSGTLGEAYPVPYNRKVDGRYQMQLQLIPGYRGLAKLARNTGQVKRIEAEVVYEHDHFRYRKGSHFVLEFEPRLDGDRGRILGFYALAELQDGQIQAEYMTKTEVDKVRASSKSADTGPWKDWYEEMGRKTVFRRLSKWLPLSGEKWSAALEVDNEDHPRQELREHPGGSKVRALVSRLEGEQTKQEDGWAEIHMAAVLEACKENGVPEEDLLAIWGPLDQLQPDPGESASELLARVVASIKEMARS